MPKPTITNEQRHENLAEFMKNFLEKNHEAIKGIQIEHNGDHTSVTVKTNDRIASDFIRMSKAWHKRDDSKVQNESPVALSETRESIRPGLFRVSKTAEIQKDSNERPVNGMHIVFRHESGAKHLTFTALEQKLRQSENLKQKMNHE